MLSTENFTVTGLFLVVCRVFILPAKVQVVSKVIVLDRTGGLELRVILGLLVLLSNKHGRFWGLPAVQVSEEPLILVVVRVGIVIETTILSIPFFIRLSKLKLLL